MGFKFGEILRHSVLFQIRGSAHNTLRQGDNTRAISEESCNSPIRTARSNPSPTKSVSLSSNTISACNDGQRCKNAGIIFARCRLPNTAGAKIPL